MQRAAKQATTEDTEEFSVKTKDKKLQVMIIKVCSGGGWPQRIFPLYSNPFSVYSVVSLVNMYCGVWSAE
jgi:hypothetical protein